MLVGESILSHVDLGNEFLGANYAVLSDEFRYVNYNATRSISSM